MLWGSSGALRGAALWQGAVEGLQAALCGSEGGCGVVEHVQGSEVTWGGGERGCGGRSEPR